jgi:para-nitrobenzyl esterase
MNAQRAAALGFLLSFAGACGDDSSPTQSNQGNATAPDGGGSSRTDAGTSGDAGTGGSTLVTVAEGKLQGKLTGNTRLFLGIPYAEPPVGALRFQPPKPVAPWTTTRAATDFGAPCPQNPGALAAPGTQSEDCLSLNVFAPTGASKLPVLVWIHGGAFIAGGSSQYDSARLAGEGPIVVVTLNYRLGALGFLSLSALDEARGDSPSGNDGIRDQQLALAWVKKNIAAFGGDPDNVTIAGESAGSQSACVHMVSPKSAGLGKRYILESGTCVGGLPTRDKAAANATGQKLADALCPGAADVLACLRDKAPTDLISWGAMDGIFGAGWSPLADADDDVLPELPLATFARAGQNKGDLLLGTNKNEWGLFLAIDSSAPPINSVASFNAAVEKQFGATVSPALEQHYAPTDDTAQASFVQLMTDAVFRCPARGLARAVSAGGSKVFLYSFEEGTAYHAFEIPYVLGVPNAQLSAATLVEPARASIQAYWRQFAKVGDPNVAGQPTWPAYTQAGDQNMTLQAASVVNTNLAQADCDFWSTVKL